MANCDDLNELLYSNADEINAHDSSSSSSGKGNNVADAEGIPADQATPQENDTAPNTVEGFHTRQNSSSSRRRRTRHLPFRNMDECSNQEGLQSSNAELAAECDQRSSGDELAMHPYIDDQGVDAPSNIVRSAAINIECSVQIEKKSVDQVLPKVAAGASVNFEESSQDAVITQSVLHTNRMDCRVIFAAKDNRCVIESATVPGCVVPINNNVAQMGGSKENELVVEATESDEFYFDTVLPLCKSSEAIGCRRNNSGLECKNRRVSFPEDDTSLITSYLEPVNPWLEMADVNHEDIVSAYRSACDKYKTSPLPAVLQQISALPLVMGGRVQCLNLRNQKLDHVQCDCLEEIFRRVQFKMINFESCGLDDESVIPLFDMIEFYDSATQLNISCNAGIGSRGWQMCAKMLKKSQSIELLDAHSTNLCEQTVPILARVLRLDTKLQTLHLENCNLTERPLVTLSGALRVNDTLTELYLADNHIGPRDCIHLENLLSLNTGLQTLDLRNNNIQDDGCRHLCQGLTLQQVQIDKTTPHSSKPRGLSNLVLWNNHLTYTSVHSIATMISNSKSLRTLNLGKNNITSEGMILLQSFLLKNKNITNFGLQATRMDDEGVIALAECLAGNNTLQRIDLRENYVRVAGISALASVLTSVNKTVLKVDLDENATALSADEEALYTDMKSSIAESCRKNHINTHVARDLVESPPQEPNGFRKASLTCETATIPCAQPVEPKRYFSPEPSPCPSPSPSPVPSPVSSRFKVCKTPENYLSVTPPVSPFVLSTSAPASLTNPLEISRSTPILTSTGATDRLSRYRFTVTKVSDEGPSLGGAAPLKTMSAPSLINTDHYHRPEALVIVPVIKAKCVDAFMPHNDSNSPADEVFVDAQDSIVAATGSLRLGHEELAKAPLAAMEGGSFDTDSEESDDKFTS